MTDLELVIIEQVEDHIDYAIARGQYKAGRFEAAKNKQLVSEVRSERTRADYDALFGRNND